jgi:hypothetical protein
MSSYPYNLLASRGVHPESSSSDVHNLDPRDLDKAEKAARIALREFRTRLRADFFLYRLRDPNGLIQLLDRCRKANRAPAPTDASVMGQDAPILLLLMHDRLSARRIWEDEQRRLAADSGLAHRLALLYYAEAQDGEERVDHVAATANWRLAIAQWVRTMADEEYWERWCDERRGSYSLAAIPTDKKQAAYDDLRVLLSKEFTAYSERYGQLGIRDRANVHRDLSLEHEIEWLGLGALRDAGGPSGGPLLVRHLGLGARVSELLIKRQKELEEYEKLEGAEFLRAKRPAVERSALRRVRFYFSTLARAALLLERGSPKEALDKIPSGYDSCAENISYQSSRDPSAAFRHDAAELAMDCHMALAAAAIDASHFDLPAARAAWRTALRLGRQNTLYAEGALAVRNQMVELGRKLTKETPNDWLDCVIATMTAAKEILAGAPGEGVDGPLASAIDRRGVRRANVNDHEAAVADLNFAFKLNPANAGIRADFCKALVFWSSDLHEALGAAQALQQLELAQRLVRDGLNQNPGDPLLIEMQNRVASELDNLTGKGGALVDRAYAGLDEAIGQPSLDAASARVSSAQQKSETGDYPGAVEDLLEALKISPNSGFAKDVLRAVCVEWARNLLNDGQIEEADAQMKLVLDHKIDPGPDRNLIEQIRWAKIFQSRGAE